MSKINRIKEQIQFCIRGELWGKLQPLLEQLHPADIADVIEDAPDDIQNQIFDLLDDETKADVLSELDDTTEAEILEELTAEEISDIAEEMAPDDAADMLAELDKLRIVGDMLIYRTEHRNPAAKGMFEQPLQRFEMSLVKGNGPLRQVHLFLLIWG